MGGVAARVRRWTPFPWIVISALVTALTPPALSTGSVRAQVAASPNIVIVITDDQRADTLGRMPATKTELVDRGVRFQKAFASHPLCCPARVSVLRGQFAHTTGIYSNEGTRGGWAVFRDSGLERSTLATWLDAEGYRTGLVGKYLNGHTATTNYVPPGWDFWRGGGAAYYNRGAPMHVTHLLTRYADEFIRGTPSETPLFLYQAYTAPHSPAKPAPRYVADQRCSGVTTSNAPSFNESDVTDKPAAVRTAPLMTPEQQTYIGTTLPTNQCRSLLSVDDGVAAIVRALQETGRLANTFFVFMADNGLFLGEHRLQDRKILTYEEAIRIPLLIRYDPLTSGTARIDQRLVMNVDIAPTIVDLVGIDVHPGCPVPPYGVCSGGFDGTSLLPLLAGTGSSWRSDILVENHQSCGVRTDAHLFARYRSGEEELYNLNADPYQLTNLLARNPSPGTLSLRDQLLARLRVLCSPPPPGVRL